MLLTSVFSLKLPILVSCLSLRNTTLIAITPFISSSAIPRLLTVVFETPLQALSDTDTSRSRSGAARLIRPIVMRIPWIIDAELYAKYEPFCLLYITASSLGTGVSVRLLFLNWI